MKNLPITVSLVSTLALSVSLATAQQNQSPEELVSQYDEDGNQSLSAVEFDKLYQAEVETSEAVGENTGSEEAGTGQASAELFTGLDTNNDGEVDASELGQSISLLSQSEEVASGSDDAAQAADEQRQEQAATRPADVEESFASDDSERAASDSSDGSDSTAEAFDELAGSPEPREREGAIRDGRGPEASPGAGVDEQAALGGAIGGQQAEEAGSAEPTLAQADPAPREENIPAATADNIDSDPGPVDEAGENIAEGQPGDEPPALGLDSGDRQDPQDLEAGAAQQTTLDDLESENAGESLAELVRSQPDDLVGMSVLSPEGEEIGEIQEFVRSNQDGEIHAVIGGGGFFGFGEDQAAVRLEELRMENDNVVWSLPGSAEDALAEHSYDESNYEPLEQEGQQQADIAASGREDEPA